MSKGSGTLEMQRRYARMYICMYVCNDRVTECTRVRRVCAAATSVHSGVHLCARSCRIRSACASRLPLDGWNSRLRYGYHYLVVSAGGRGRGEGVMANLVSGFSGLLEAF